MGMKSMFEKGNFSKISEPLQIIDKFVQVTYISLDERGTLATNAKGDQFLFLFIRFLVYIIVGLVGGPCSHVKTCHILEIR